MKIIFAMAGLLLTLGTASAQVSPPETASGKIGDATLTVKYCAPSVRGRKIFGDGGRVMQDPTAPIWRAGANDATALRVTADVMVGGVAVTKGNYTLYVNVKDPDAWELVTSKQTGQWGTVYNQNQDLGRTAMTQNALAAPQEMMTISFENTHAKTTELHVKWEKVDEYVTVTAQ